MEIDRILYPITSLGPGKRMAMWTIGCDRHCENCANKELWNENPRKNISVNAAFRFIKNISLNYQIDGFTITGGEPLRQDRELFELIKLMNRITNDIIMYTGYLLKDISKTTMDFLRENISLLIDGPYIADLNDNGSTLHYFKQKYITKYKKYLSEGRKIQNIFYEQKLISVGISDKGK